MQKIANTSELKSELQSLLEYSRSPQPSRKRIARELRTLSARLKAGRGGPPMIGLKVQAALAKASDGLDTVQGSLQELQMDLDLEGGYDRALPVFERVLQTIRQASQLLKRLDTML